jgi:hypothetical protein
MDTSKIQGQFPLFSHLKNEVGDENTGLSTAQKIELGERIKELDEQGCSLVYALIRYYQIYEEKINIVETPFGMKKIKLGYRFCIDDLPILLQHLIWRFVQIHRKSQKERIESQM